MVNEIQNVRMRILSRISVNRRALKLRLLSTAAAPQICVVGSGPAGFYTSQGILKGHADARVTIVDKLPAPFGLVRYGVAPDHPEVKNVINSFTNALKNERCNFLGNVNIGKDVTFQELREAYHAIVLCYGAQEDRRLNIPGEDLPNVFSARSFVGWYNGLPENADLGVNCDVDTVAVIGHGNVALDVARILLSPLDELRKTDIAPYALEKLSRSKVKRLCLVGRRGPLQVAFTIKELREMVKLEGCRSIIRKHDFEGVQQILHDLPRPRRRLTELMLSNSCEDEDKLRCGESREWQLMFLKRPLSITENPSSDHRLRLLLGINKLKGVGDNTQVENTESTEALDCGMVLASIGYQIVPIDATVPFDPKKGVIPNEKGRVSERSGLYCSGWVKTGPAGVIASTMNASFETAQTIVEDIKCGRVDLNQRRSGHLGITKDLENRGIKFITYDDWVKIDKEEVERGLRAGKPREKIASISEMIKLTK